MYTQPVLSPMWLILPTRHWEPPQEFGCPSNWCWRSACTKWASTGIVVCAVAPGVWAVSSDRDWHFVNGEQFGWWTQTLCATAVQMAWRRRSAAPKLYDGSCDGGACGLGCCAWPNRLRRRTNRTRWTLRRYPMTMMANQCARGKSDCATRAIGCRSCRQ